VSVTYSCDYDTEIPERRREDQPLMNDQFKLCLFAANLNCGQTFSYAEGVHHPTWPNNERLAQMADRAGFEAIIPVARWIGFGGPSQYHASSFETFTWAAALAALTKYSTIVSTSHIPALHPLVAAKQCVTIDHASRGRFGLNLVAGWFNQEIDYFGAKLLPHYDRYAQAEEWLDVVKKLWSVKGEFDYEGQYYNLKRAFAEPKPITKPFPPIINAAQSPIGRRWTAKNADVYFTGAKTFELMETQVREMKMLAREEFGREIVVLIDSVVMCAPTEKEALDYRREIIAKGDYEAAMNNRNIDAKKHDDPNAKAPDIPESFIAAYGSNEIVGSPEQVADYFLKMKQLGCDGVAFSFMGRWEQNLKLITEEVIPMMVQAGARREFVAPS
jgi:alkanesulfonate monooxygenase SsuD/methylene tetrahydromethanopterin reductase-like flavin-dependent oxidoreductase (luciferase family)